MRVPPPSGGGLQKGTPLSLKSWKNAALFTAAEIYPPTDLDNANTSVTNFDVTGYGPGARFLVLVTVLPNEATDTGMTFKFQDTTASGGADVDMPATHATTASSTPGTTSQARHVLEMSFTPQAGRPWITLVGTKVDVESDVTVQAHLIAYKNV